jgi:amidase
LGAIIVDPVEIMTAGELSEPEDELLLYEFKADLNAYLADRPELPLRSLQEIIAFNQRNREKMMPYFGQELMIKAQEKGPLTDEAYREALEACRRLARTEGIDATLGEHELDAIVAPSGGPPWLTDWVNGDHFSGGSSAPAAVAGYPNVTVPAGYISGLPVGISFFAGAYQEPTLIRLAYAFEQATRVRQVPRYLTTAELDGSSMFSDKL